MCINSFEPCAVLLIQDGIHMEIPMYREDVLQHHFKKNPDCKIIILTTFHFNSAKFKYYLTLDNILALP